MILPAPNDSKLLSSSALVPETLSIATIGSDFLSKN